MCESVFLLTLFKIVDMLIMVLKIALPLLIIAKSSRDFFKPTITGNSDDIVKAGNSLLMRLLSAFIIFALPTLVNIAMGMAVKDIDTNNADCLFNVTDVMIENAKVSAANRAVEQAKNDSSYNNIQNARSKVEALESGATKDYLDANVSSLEQDYKDEQERKRQEAAERARENPGSSSGGGSSYSGAISLTGTDEEIRNYIQNRYNSLVAKSSVCCPTCGSHAYYSSYCGGLVCDQLTSEGLISDADKTDSGCDQARYIARNGVTGTGHQVKGYEMHRSDYNANVSTFENMIAENGGTLENVVISFAGNSNQLHSVHGHVCLITKIADGKVYMVDNVVHTQNPNGPGYVAMVMPLSEFEFHWFTPFDAVYMAHIY